jgi:hypothetical protein
MKRNVMAQEVTTGEKPGGTGRRRPADRDRIVYTEDMARLILRLLGLSVLAVAIVIPGCQALFPPEPASATRPATGEMRDGQGR